LNRIWASSILTPHSPRRSQTAATKHLNLQNQELTTHRDWLLPMLMNGQVRITG
jgi:hypothetical protein